MRKILALFCLIPSIAFAESAIDINASTKNYEIKVNKFIGINSYHVVNIKNTENRINKYRYSYCIGLDNSFICNEKLITLKSGKSFNDHDINFMHVSKNKPGIYKITATTKVNDMKKESYGTLTIN